MNNIIVEDIKNIILDKNLNFDKLRNKKILITGATGMLASYLVYLFSYLNLCKNLDIKDRKSVV